MSKNAKWFQNYKSLLKMLYPLKFSSQLKYRIWGGTRLRDLYGKKTPESMEKCGESWELSAVEGSLSVVENGFLAGNDIQELAEVYMADLVGEDIFQKFGVEFPLLIKFIDTNDYLSVQVHPDNEMAKRLHHAFGKTELWYVMAAESDSQIVSGFNRKIKPDEFKLALDSDKLPSLLKQELVRADDLVYVPARSIHALGKGITLVEIQQTSDVTYRVYDWNRTEPDGTKRQLHTDLALEAIDFEAEPTLTERTSIEENVPQELKQTPFFSVNRLYLTKKVERDFFELDTFRIYICLEGAAGIRSANADEVLISKGELVLVPAIITSVVIAPQGETKLLEVFI